MNRCLIILLIIFVTKLVFSFEVNESYTQNITYYTNKWPERNESLQTINVLFDNVGTLKKVYNIFIDDPRNFPEVNLLIYQVYTWQRFKFKSSEIYDRLRPLPESVKTEVMRHLGFFESIIPDFKFNINPNATKYDLAIYAFDYDQGPRGVTMSRSELVSSIVFLTSLKEKYRSWVPQHELFHQMFNAEHDQNGRPIGYTDIQPLDVEESIVVYTDSLDFKVPGYGTDRTKIFYGQQDWINLQYRFNLTNPYHTKINVELTGDNNVRGSPGPTSWIDKIIVGPKIRFYEPFSTYVENCMLLNEMYQLDYIWLAPYIFKEGAKSWYNLWNLDVINIETKSGKSLFNYRSDFMKGPSFNPHNDEEEFNIVVRNTMIANVGLYGYKKLHIDNVDFVKLTVGPEVVADIYDFNPFTSIVKISDNDRVLKHYDLEMKDDDAVLTFRTKLLDGYFDSVVVFHNIDKKHLHVCGGPNDTFDTCPPTPTKTFWNLVIGVLSMYTIIFIVGFIILIIVSIMVCIFLCCFSTCICCCISSILIAFPAIIGTFARFLGGLFIVLIAFVNSQRVPKKQLSAQTSIDNDIENNKL